MMSTFSNWDWLLLLGLPLGVVFLSIVMWSRRRRLDRVTGLNGTADRHARATYTTLEIFGIAGSIFSLLIVFMTIAGKL